MRRQQTSLQLTWGSPQWGVPADALPAALFEDFSARTNYSAGLAYYALLPNVTSAEVVLTGGSTQHCANVTWVLQPSPPGFYINTATGGVHAHPASVYPLTATCLTAQCEGVSECIARFDIAVVLPDTADPAYGPGGQDCALPFQRVDTVEYVKSPSNTCTRRQQTDTRTHTTIHKFNNRKQTTAYLRPNPVAVLRYASFACTSRDCVSVPIM
jgi:hypothetical protein